MTNDIIKSIALFVKVEKALTKHGPTFLGDFATAETLIIET